MRQSATRHVHVATRRAARRLRAVIAVAVPAARDARGTGAPARHPHARTLVPTWARPAVASIPATAPRTVSAASHQSSLRRAGDAAGRRPLTRRDDRHRRDADEVTDADADGEAGADADADGDAGAGVGGCTGTA